MSKLTDITLQCCRCEETYEPWKERYFCVCGGLLEVAHAKNFWSRLSREPFERRLAGRKPIDRSGVWRFREGVLPLEDDEIVTHPEGGTPLYSRDSLGTFAGITQLSPAG